MLRIGFSCLLLFLLSACATTKRPIVYEAADFEGKAVRKADASFLISGGIDVDLFVPDLIAAFDGGPSQAVTQMERSLRNLLVGAQSFQARKSGGGFSTDTRALQFRDLHAQVDSTFVAEQIVVTTDEYGVVAVEVSDPESLASRLEQVGAPYLLIFGGLRLEPRHSNEPNLFTGATQYKQDVVLTGQVLVWDTAQKSLVWHGYVSGFAYKTAAFGGKDEVFYLSSVEGLVGDLMVALR